MGPDWRKMGYLVESERPCECGAGEVQIKVEIEESHSPPFERIGARYIVKNCPKKCE